MTNRLADPSEICALDFKHEFRRSTICSVSDTIGIDRPILGIFRNDWGHQLSEKRPSATAQRASVRSVAVAPIGRCSARGDYLWLDTKRESRTVVLGVTSSRRKKTATHRFLRAEAATLRDTLDRRARLRKQAPRRLHPQPLDGASRRLPGCLRIVSAETALVI